MKIKKDTVLMLSNGAYSDYGVEGPYRVLKTFDQVKVCESFKAEWEAKNNPKLHSWSAPSTNQFIAWLHSNGYIEDIAAHQWYLGDMDFDPVIQ